MKKLLLFAFTCLVVSNRIFAQDLSGDSAWVADHYHKMEKYITMRDGVRLFTSIYIPNDKSEKHPILMTRTPYSCAPYGDSAFTTWSKTLRMVYFKENYIMVYQDVRGCYMSEGKFEDVRPFNPNKKTSKDIDEASDTYDAIDWLVKNIPGNNGNVGVFGISYPGFYSTMAAMSGHPALKAVSPQAPVTDWFLGDDFHHKGVFFEMDAFNFDRSFGVPRPFPRKQGPSIPPVVGDDNYNFFLKAGALKNITAKYMDSIVFWKDMMAHPVYDNFWQERNARKYISNLKPAILLVGGLFDAEDCYGTWETFKTIDTKSPGTVNKIIMGPWAHNNWKLYNRDRLGNVYFSHQTSDWFQNEVELKFFNYYLKGKGDGDQLAKATIYMTGENNWHRFNQWPPQNVTTQPLYLHSNNTLSFEKPNGKNSYDSYVSDPSKPVPYTEDVHSGRTREYMTDDQRFASRRPDVLTYETAALEKDLTLTGLLSADLFTSISTTDADFVVKVIDVFPNDFKYPDSLKWTYPMGGYQMLVRGEIMRGKFRNSFEKPEAFEPNKITEVKFDLPDVAHTFQKGHKLMIQIQSSWFPLADRNPQQFTDIYKCDDKDFIKSTIHIYHDIEHPSQLLLPVLAQ